MISEFFFFWIFFILLVEILVSKSNTNYILSLFFYILLVGIIFLFWKEFDLFASILLAVYSSVFLILLLFYVYFNRYINKIFSETTADLSVVWDILIFISSVISIYSLYTFNGYFFFQNTILNINFSWIYQIIFIDSYWSFAEKSVYTTNLMHVVLYKLFSIEIFFLNVYLLLGLLASIVFLFFLKINYNPAFLTKFFSLSRYSFHFFFFKNSRVRVMNAFRRQIRLKNTSNIKFKF